MTVLRRFINDVQTVDSESRKADRVIVSNQIQGEFSPSGLNEAIKTTTLTVTDTATPLPSTALTNRNSLVILNKSSTATLYLGNSDVTADTVAGTTSGLEVFPGSFFNIDITENIILYARCETGQSALVKITEVA